MNDLRQIKFRAWDREDKKYYKVVLIGFTVGEAKLQSGQYEVWRPLKDAVLEQFTGLYDSTKWEELTEKEKSLWLADNTAEEWKGREIYEGDIVSYRYCAGACNYDQASIISWKSTGFHMEPIGGGLSAWLISVPGGYKEESHNLFTVIGNIHENRELTEQL